jgi:DNA-3-methyladenine glycosylase
MDLLNKILVRAEGQEILSGRIVEVEAYTGENDPGSHAYRGETPRTKVMFGEPGHLYVYFTYGMHFCLNVVTDEAGVAGAVLLRALEPLEGQETMQHRRGATNRLGFTNGPAKICQAFGVTRAQNGLDLTGTEMWIEDDGTSPAEVGRSGRIGLSAGASLPYRLFVVGKPFVSRFK